MPKKDAFPSPVVSPRVYSLIATSARLSDLIIPEGPQGSPYEVLDYDATLTLHDPQGQHATFQRTQWVRFLQDGVGAILDHAWGDGVVFSSYRNDAGRVGDSFRDGGRRHLVIELPRRMAKGETTPMRVTRSVSGGFTKNEEWVETLVDHPIRQLKRSVIFPKARPCLRATLHVDQWELDLPIFKVPGGGTMVRFEIEKATANTPFLLTWSW